MKKIVWGILFGLVMSVYALLRDFRDAFFINVVGLASLPYAKMASLLFLLVELFIYQKFMIAKGPRRSFLMILSFYIAICFLSGFWLYFHQQLAWQCGYLFYVCAEGFPPFIWGALWMIAVSIKSQEKSIDNSLYFSLCAQGGALITVVLFSKIGIWFGAYQNIFFGFVLLIVALMLCVVGILFYWATKSSTIDHQIISDKLIHNKNILTIWKEGAKSIGASGYLKGIIFIMLSWEFVNIISNYVRLSVFSEGNQGINLLSNLYGTMRYTYLLGFFLVLRAWFALQGSNKNKKLKIIHILWIFPILILIMGLVLYYDQIKSHFIFLYMVLRAFYPALIFPLKEAFFSITDNKTKFIIKSWIDSFISRFGKLLASIYISTVHFQYEGAYTIYIHSLMWISIIGILFYVLYTVEKKYANTINLSE